MTKKAFDKIAKEMDSVGLYGARTYASDRLSLRGSVNESSDIEHPQEDAFMISQRAPAAPITSDGGSTSYYDLPKDATELNDLIEHKRMSFALGNIFKACYRFGEKDAASRMYDLNKIIYFAERLRAQERRAGA